MPDDSSFKATRRRFLIQTLQAAAVTTLLPSVLSSCSTLDEYLIEDQFDFTQEVVIIGGGISGLYAAYQLKKNKIPFKIFDSSQRLGGKIQTIDEMEWGAFEFRKGDEILNKLSKELNLEKMDLDKTTWTYKQGASALVTELSDIVQGLIPERQIRFQHRLSLIRKLGSRYQLTFQTPQKEKTYFARKVILALPQEVLFKLQGLDEIKETKPLLSQIVGAKNWAMVRVNLPIGALNTNYRKNNKAEIDVIESAFYRAAAQAPAEIFVRQKNSDLMLTFRLAQDHPLRPIENLETFVQKITETPLTLNSENCKDWGLVALDTRANHNIDMKTIVFPTGRLKVITEALVAESPTNNKSSIESLLQIVDHEIQSFRLDI